MSKEAKFYGRHALIWIMANPILALVLVIIAIVAGGLVLADFFALFTNPYIWILSIVGSIILIMGRLERYGLFMALFLAAIWFGITMEVCEIPIICWILDIFMFIPKIFHFIIIVAAILVQMTILDFIRMAIKKR